jgi:SAM-dependent methyltransferase
MCHEAQQQFVGLVRAAQPRHFTKCRVLEVGSLNINGSVRQFFSDCWYLGVDLGVGRDVDLVSHVCDLPECYGPFDTVISCESLEHDARWQESLRRMWALLAPGGLLLVTCAGPARPPHGIASCEPECSPFTLDYYSSISDEQVRDALHVPLCFLSTARDTRFWGLKPL